MFYCEFSQLYERRANHRFSEVWAGIINIIHLNFIGIVSIGDPKLIKRFTLPTSCGSILWLGVRHQFITVVVSEHFFASGNCFFMEYCKIWISNTQRIDSFVGHKFSKNRIRNGFPLGGDFTGTWFKVKRFFWQEIQTFVVHATTYISVDERH